MKLLELKGQVNPTKNYKKVISLENLESVSVNGCAIHIKTTTNSYTEFHCDELTAERRYDDIVLNLTREQHDESVDIPVPATPKLYTDNEVYAAAPHIFEYKFICEADKISVEDEQEGVTVEYPFDGRTLVDVCSAHSRAFVDNYNAIYNYYDDYLNFPVGHIDKHAEYVEQDSSSIPLIATITAAAVAMSQDKNVPADIFVRYAGHTNEFEVEIFIGGWEFRDEPQFIYRANGGATQSVFRFDCTLLESLSDVAWLLEELKEYTVDNIPNDTVNDLRYKLSRRHEEE
jgi:hypothetical protein